MKIVIAPDSFKESLTSVEAATCIEEGFRQVFPDAEYVRVPIADGGEGTVQAMVSATSGHLVEVVVTGPLGDPVNAFYGVTGDGQTAVIEMAAASGLALVPENRRNPLQTTSFGTGELIKHALNAGLRRFVIGIGGSSTIDAGAGMLQALGAHFINRQGLEVGHGGGHLAELEHISCCDLDPRLRASQILAACDVNNPLTGSRGAAHVFGPQKGASPQMVEVLDASLAHFARIVSRDLGKQIDQAPGAGAAGGMGAALMAFLNADLKPGIEVVLEAVKLEEKLLGADLLITGEGRIDGQSVHGKAPVGVARIATRQGIPVIGFAGSLGEDAEIVKEHGIAALYSIVKGPCELTRALAMAADNLKNLSRNVAATINLYI